MSYATKTDMLARYEEQELTQLTDFAEPYTGAIVDSVLEQALSDASSKIDMYLSNRYDTPITNPPAALVDMCCTLAFYRLNRGRYTEDLRQDYQDVMQELKDIADGETRVDQGGDEPGSTAAIAKIDGPNRTFNRDSLKGF